MLTWLSRRHPLDIKLLLRSFNFGIFALAILFFCNHWTEILMLTVDVKWCTHFCGQMSSNTCQWFHTPSLKMEVKWLYPAWRGSVPSDLVTPTSSSCRTRCWWAWPWTWSRCSASCRPGASGAPSPGGWVAWRGRRCPGSSRRRRPPGSGSGSLERGSGPRPRTPAGRDTGPACFPADRRGHPPPWREETGRHEGLYISLTFNFNALNDIY